MQNQTMKKRLIYILPFLLSAVLFSCRSGNDPFDAGNHRFPWEKKSPVMYTVKLSLDGDYITETEEPLTRDDDKYTYVGIKVTRVESEKDNPKIEKYAYGLFKFTSDEFNAGNYEIKIDLWSGYLYSFDATILKEGTDNVGLKDNKFYQPFRTAIESFSDPQTGLPFGDALGVFHYNNSSDDIYYFQELDNGSALVDHGGDNIMSSSNLVYDNPRLKRFYGKTESPIDPAIDQEVVIGVDYKSFGLKINVVELPSDSYVTVYDITNYDNFGFYSYQDCLLFPKDLKLGIEESKGYRKSWSDIYSMKSFTVSYETFKLEFTLKREGLEDKTFSSKVEVHPKKMKVLNLTITEGSTKNQGNVTFNFNEVDEDFENDTSQESNDISFVAK